jgi:hypothetical protein
MRAVSVVALSLLALLPVAASAGDEIAFAPSDRPSITETDRAAIADYYRSEYRNGDCPDGLVHTEQGCSRKPLWTLGAPIDPTVPVEALPAPLLAQLSPAPEGTRYIRVADRVLLMEIKSRMIQAELLDLGRVGFGRLAPRLRLSGGSGASR